MLLCAADPVGFVFPIIFEKRGSRLESFMPLASPFSDMYALLHNLDKVRYDVLL